MRVIKTASLVVILLALSSLSLYAGASYESMEPFDKPSARFSALGGNHSAAVEDFDSLLLNPGSMADVEREIAIAELTTSVNGPIFGILDFATSAQDSLSKMGSGDEGSLDALGKLGDLMDSKGFHLGLNAAGPFSSGYVGKGLGIGLFNRTRADVNLVGMNFKPTVSEDIFLMGGYAFNVIDNGPHRLNVGFMAKGFARGAASQNMSLLDVLNLDFESLPFKTYYGGGLDLGARYQFAKTLKAAIVYYDVYSPAYINYYTVKSAMDSGSPISSGGYGIVKPRLNLGLAWEPHIPLLEKFLKLQVMADYQDLLDGFYAVIPRNPILNLSVGVEAELFDIVSIRVGVGDTLPALGLGIDARAFKFDAAFYGKELGLDPGQRPVFAMDLGLLFRY